MVRYIYNIVVIACLLLAWGGCSSDHVGDADPMSGDTPIRLSGMVTRAAGDGAIISSGYPLEAYGTGGVKFYMTARTVSPAVVTYFANQSMSIGDRVGADADAGRNFLTANVYYPLNENPIHLFAHTGTAADTSGNIPLKAGTAIGNDYLLGKGTDEYGAVVSGHSQDRIEYMTFRHLMTRVDVKMEVASEVEVQKPQSINMTFSMADGLIVNAGSYNIFAGVNAVNAATAPYSFTNIGTTATTHYLVPNGANLTTASQVLSSLTIDDYTATAADLANISIPQTDQGVDIVLNPGLSYELTFVIKRLKLEEIRVKLTDWNTAPGSPEWGYTPKTVNLNTADYPVTNTQNMVSKMVLHYKHTDNVTYQYVGKGKLEGGVNKVDFITLPPASSMTDGTLTADLYTSFGPLVQGVTVNADAMGTALEIPDLGPYGMVRGVDDVYMITTAQQFALMLNDNSKASGTKYSMLRDLDMDNTTIEITPTAFPAGSILEGNGKEILHLNIDGNGLFTENRGTLKNFRIVSGRFKGSGTEAVGSMAQVNYGSIEACVNNADIQIGSAQMFAGGICGRNVGTGTVKASVNTGNLLKDGTGTSCNIGGIVGSNENPAGGAVTACLNTGMLCKWANNLGGIVGVSVVPDSGPTVKTCYWLTGTARSYQYISEEFAVGNNIGSDNESADLAPAVLRSPVTIAKLSAAAGPSWKYELDVALSSWPLPKPF